MVYMYVAPIWHVHVSLHVCACALHVAAAFKTRREAPLNGARTRLLA